MNRVKWKVFLQHFPSLIPFPRLNHCRQLGLCLYDLFSLSLWKDMTQTDSSPSSSPGLSVLLHKVELIIVLYVIARMGLVSLSKAP